MRLDELAIGPWPGLGVLATYAGFALLSGVTLFQLRDAGSPHRHGVTATPAIGSGAVQRIRHEVELPLREPSHRDRDDFVQFERCAHRGRSAPMGARMASHDGQSPARVEGAGGSKMVGGEASCTRPTSMPDRARGSATW
jgi:hypothetical protein